MKLPFSLILTELLLNSIIEGVFSECVYEEAEYFPGKQGKVIEATCYEVSSELSPSIDQENATLIRILRVSENSTIQRLHPSSSLSSLSALSILELGSAKIEEIIPGVFDNSTELISIDLRNNLLKIIPVGIFNKLVQLEELNLSKNQLSKIFADVFANLRSLENLDLSENHINHFDGDSFSDLLALQKLALQNNEIAVLPKSLFRNLTNLIQLDLSSNLLKELPVFDTLVNLEVLNLTKNQISQVEVGTFDKLSRLWWLYLSENLITRLDDGIFSSLVSLRGLKIQENKITLLQEDLFKNLTNLITFDASGNPLDEIQDVGFNRRLASVIIDRTKLKKFALNISTTHLVVSEGLLEDIDFSYLKSSDYIVDLSSNHLKVVKNLQEATATIILLYNNNLTKIQNFSPNLEQLFLQHNQITRLEKIQDTSNYKMLSLDVSFNQLDSATCLGLPELKDLNLQNNQIVVINQKDFLGCLALSKLNLAFNTIDAIEANAFKALTVLEDLRLSNNRLKSLNPESFFGLNSLTVLYVDNNKISSLEVEELRKSVPKLLEMKVSGNEIKCKDLDSITFTVKQLNISIVDEDAIDEVKCIQN